MSANDNLAGVKRTFLSPFRLVYLQQPRQRSGGFGSSGVGHPLPILLRLVATVLLARSRIFLVFLLHACCRPSSG